MKSKRRYLLSLKRKVGESPGLSVTLQCPSYQEQVEQQQEYEEEKEQEAEKKEEQEKQEKQRQEQEKEGKEEYFYNDTVIALPRAHQVFLHVFLTAIAEGGP